MMAKEFWIFKGTSNFCNEMVMNDDFEFEKAMPDGFYDIVSSRDTVSGGIHVIEYAAYARLKQALELARKQRDSHIVYSMHLGTREKYLGDLDAEIEKILDPK